MGPNKDETSHGLSKSFQKPCGIAVNSASMFVIFDEFAAREDSTILPSKPEYVCRVPIYLSRGLARARVQKVNTVRLDQSQLQKAMALHSVLAELLTELTHYEFYSVDSEACQNYKLRIFDHYDWNPEQSLFMGLLTITKNKLIDWTASDQLLRWSKTMGLWRMGVSKTQSIVEVHSSGIISAYPCVLSSLPPSMYHGRLVRPRSLPKHDLGLFVVCDSISASCPTKQGDKNTVSCYRISRHLNACRVNSGLSEKTSSWKPINFRISDCFVHPLPAWLWFSLTLIPPILYQTNRALLSAEFCVKLAQFVTPSATNCWSVVSPLTVLVPDRLDAPNGMLRQLYHSTVNDKQAEASNTGQNWDKKVATKLPTSYPIPGPTELLKATTLLGAADSVNLERLEFIGDSLLQLITTLQVYQNSSLQADEQQLTNKRSVLVSNANLYSIVVREQWYRYCTTRPFDIRDLFIPPCYTLKSQYQEPDDPRIYVKLTDKSLADMIEALLGCFLQCIGIRGACGLLQRFGISFMDCINDTFNSSASMWRCFFQDAVCLTNQLSKLTIGSARGDEATKAELDAGISILQGRLGYVFKNQALLHEARTHSSYSSLKPTVCYQRLEFLGDAVLGYVVSNDLFKRFPDYDPGMLTNHRSLIVNNLVLARVLVDLKLHDGIRHNIPSLPSMVDKLRSVRLADVTSLSELREKIQTNITASPMKILGDVFESLIGAVFVDTNGDLQVIQTIVHRLLGKVLMTRERARSIRRSEILFTFNKDLVRGGDPLIL
ncbi:dicer-like protein 1 [Clonorchis sinensis]|uniref:Dicer-like protein 1 n=1 Tax=Clonorchis sinensis TaxID=79923 RepID=G7YCT2_CLOSI|nr:dicer-like protein 1 [Clonorchis sinensis]